MYKVLPYKTGSESARILSESLGGLRLKTETSKPLRVREGDTIINWGASKRLPRFAGVPMLNDPEAVARCVDKLLFFENMTAGAPEITPDYWTNKKDIPKKAYPIVCRTVLNGHSGEGIVIAHNKDELVDAPLYVKYIKKSQEYRVHVGRVVGRKNPDKIIAIQRKARLRSVPDSEVNWEIRSHDNGFVFARQNVAPPARVTDAARQALEVMELDFGAVDVIDHESKERAYALEINTAPGLEGQTVVDYTNYFDHKPIEGVFQKASIRANEDGTWHVAIPKMDDYARLFYYIDDVPTWDEAVRMVNA